MNKDRIALPERNIHKKFVILIMVLCIDDGFVHCIDSSELHKFYFYWSFFGKKKKKKKNL